MRLGYAHFPSVCAVYRAIEPLQAMARRGHDVVGPRDADGEVDVARLRGCDVVHVYRRYDAASQRALVALADAGSAIVYDNDDNLAAVPKESPNYRQYGGMAGQKAHAMTVKVARRAQLFTTKEQGGRLVADDGWLDALERLVTRPRERKRLARKGRAWAKRNTMDAAADRWERVFAEAAQRSPSRPFAARAAGG